MEDLDKLLSQLQRVVQKKSSDSRSVGEDSELYEMCIDGLSKAMDRDAVDKVFANCLGKAVDQLGVLRGIRAIMSEIIRTIGSIVDSTEEDQKYDAAELAMLEMVVDFGLAEIALICKEKLDEGV